MEIDNPTFTNLSAATVASGDKLIGQDVDDSDNTKTYTASSVATLALALISAGDGIDYDSGTGVISADINTTNLKFTSTEINTIQNIATSSSPQFTGLTLSGLTQGSVIFAGASGALSQDNNNFFWDDANNWFGIGTSSPAELLDVAGDILVGSHTSGSGEIRFRDGSTGADNNRFRITLDSSNNTRIQNTGSGTTFTVYNATGNINFTLFNGTAEYTAVTIGGSTGKVALGAGATAGTARLTLGTGVSEEVLRFNIERAWTWKQGSSGANATIDFLPVVDAKHFRVRTQDETKSPLDVYAANSGAYVSVADGAKFTVGRTYPASTPTYLAEFYQNDTATGTSAGVNIEQDGTGDAAMHWTLTGGQAYHAYIDNSDSDLFKIDATSTTGIQMNTSAYVNVPTKLAIGTTTAATEELEVVQDGSGGSIVQVTNAYTGSSGGAIANFRKSRGTIASPTIVSIGDVLGRLSFYGYDGSNFIEGCRISSEVDNTPGTNDMPSTWVMSTTADGASSPTERLRIRHNGNFAINGSSGTGYGGMVGGIYKANVTTAPTSAPSGGGFLYVESGALKYMGSSGTITTLGAA